MNGMVVFILAIGTGVFLSWLYALCDNRARAAEIERNESLNALAKKAIQISCYDVPIDLVMEQLRDEDLSGFHLDHLREAGTV